MNFLICLFIHFPTDLIVESMKLENAITCFPSNLHLSWFDKIFSCQMPIVPWVETFRNRLVLPYKPQVPIPSQGSSFRRLTSDKEGVEDRIWVTTPKRTGLFVALSPNWCGLEIRHSQSQSRQSQLTRWVQFFNSLRCVTPGKRCLCFSDNTDWQVGNNDSCL